MGSGGPPLLPVACEHVPTWWFQTDFLLWWIKSGPLSVPLVTTGSVNDANPGALGQPNTQVLFGGNGLNYGAFGGARLDLGAWLDAHDRFGFDAGFFVLGQETTTFRAFSDANGNPVLSVPILNAQTQQPDQVTVASPGSYAGGVIVRSSSSLWGTNLSGLVNVYREGGLQMSLIGGFRFLYLNEDLRLSTPDTDISSGPSSGTSFNTVDDFRTINQFYGGQIGARVGYRWRYVTLDLLGAVAFGSTHQALDINGFSSVLGPQSLTPQITPGGIFAQPTNIGHYSAWAFAVVPEAQLKLGFDLMHNLRFTLGYDFIYWSSVIRPGAQVNSTVNLSQSPVLASGTLTGPAQPLPLFNRSDFFTQGLNVGLELRW
jgi:hypothetical protein